MPSATIGEATTRSSSSAGADVDAPGLLQHVADGDVMHTWLA